MLRLSVEIEDANDLIADFQQVLVASISRSVSGALQEQQLIQLYYQGKLSMEDYMRATLALWIGLNTQTVADWVQRYIRSERYHVARLPRRPLTPTVAPRAW